MKKILLNQSAATACEGQTGAGAFTLTELFVVTGVAALLAMVLLSASFTTQEGALRAECVASLRQIGTALNVYSTEANGYLPIDSWPCGQQPWQAAQLCRVQPGTSTITRGPTGLGMLWSAKILPNPKVFYCPSMAKNVSSYEGYTYDYYFLNGPNWPSPPPVQPWSGAAEMQVRSSYMYYPQLKIVETISGHVLPKFDCSCPSVTLVSPNPNDPPEISVQLPCLKKFVDVDPGKVMVVDVLMTLSGLAHRNNGQPAGVNALFPDGHVKFQPVSENSGVNQAFYAPVWNSLSGSALGNDVWPSPNFRTIVTLFQP